MSRLLAEAFKTVGITEWDGPPDNPLIMQWAKELGIEDKFIHDSQAWCTLWFWAMAHRAGLPVLRKDLLLWSIAVAKWGTERVGGPELGDVVVTWRPDPFRAIPDGQLGHVQIFLGVLNNHSTSNGSWLVIGGNVNNTVAITDRIIRPNFNLVSVRIPPDAVPIPPVEPALQAA